MTPPRSRWSRSAAGGTLLAAASTRRPGGCWSRRTRAGPTGTGPGRGRRGWPLTSHDVIINSIAATTTRTGLTVQARLDGGSYPTGVKVSNAQMAALPVGRHSFHGDWNYTLHPAAGHTAGPPACHDQERRPAELLPEL